jgi:hypothetical protein
MTAQTQPGVRLTAWRWRSSPLRRRCDVVEAWTLALTLAAVLLGAPLTAVLYGRSVYGAGQADADRLRATSRAVRATLTRAASGPAHAAPDTVLPSRVAVSVHWTDPDGSRRTAVVKVATGTRAGSATDVWLNAERQVVSGPLPEEQILTAAVGWGITVLLAGWACAAVGWFAVRQVAHRHRMAEWARDWATTAPRWTGRV